MWKIVCPASMLPLPATEHPPKRQVPEPSYGGAIPRHWSWFCKVTSCSVAHWGASPKSLPKAARKVSLSSCTEERSTSRHMVTHSGQRLASKTLLLPEGAQPSFQEEKGIHVLWKASTSSSESLSFLLLKRLRTVSNLKEFPEDYYSLLLHTAPVKPWFISPALHTGPHNESRAASKPWLLCFGYKRQPGQRSLRYQAVTHILENTGLSLPFPTGAFLGTTSGFIRHTIFWRASLHWEVLHTAHCAPIKLLPGKSGDCDFIQHLFMGIRQDLSKPPRERSIHQHWETQRASLRTCCTHCFSLRDLEAFQRC